MILILKILSPHQIYKKKNVGLITIINFILILTICVTLAHENDVITNYDNIINTPDTQIQEQRKSN